jgi:hypothetical protein
MYYIDWAQDYASYLLFVFMSLPLVTVTLPPVLSMPPKRKENSATPAVSGPKPKRSKPTFRTPGPTTAGLEATTASSEVSSTKNRVVTLRASTSGRRGYRTQDLATPSNSNPASPAAELSDLPSHIPDECDSISHPTEESDIHLSPGTGTRSRPKQKNTTTVRPQLIIAGISLTCNIDKTY